MGGEVHLPEVELVIIQYDPHRPDSPAVRDGYAAGIDVFRLTDAYDRLTLTQNLGFWLVNGEPVAEVKDPRVAFLYELSRDRHALLGGAKPGNEPPEGEKAQSEES